MRRTTIAFFVCALAELAVAQQAARTIHGTAQLGDGTPWADATVHLLWRAEPQHADVGVAEHVEVRTDAAGHFRSPFPSGRPCTVWAIDPSEAGRYRVSNVLQAVTSTDAPRLRHQGFQHHRVVRFEGLQSWSERGPFRYRVQSGIGHPAVVTGVLEAEHTLTLPALPGPTATLCVMAQDGLLLGWYRISLTTGSTTTVKVLPPRRVRAWVRAEAAGSSAGARIVQTTPWGPEVIAVLGNDGRGELELPIATDRLPFYGRWLADAPTLGLGMIEVDKLSLDADSQRFRADGGTILGTTLFPTKAITGRVLVHGDTPAVGVPVVVDGTTRARFPDGGLNAHDVVRVAVTGNDGSFRIDGLTADEKTVVRAVLTGDVLAGLGDESAGMPADLVLAMDVTAERAALRDIVLDRDICAFTIQWELPDGRPAAGVQVALVDTGTLGGPVTRVPSDRLGRTSFWMPRGGTFDVAAAHDEGVFVGRFTVTGGIAAQRRALCPVRLDAGVVVTGRAMNGEQPVVGADISAYPGVQVAPQLLTTPHEPPNASGLRLRPTTMSGWQARTAAWVIAKKLSDCVSGEDGSFRTRVPRIAGALHVHGSRRTGDQLLQGTASLPLGPEDVSLQLVLQVLPHHR